MRRRNAFFVPRGGDTYAYGDFPKSAWYIWATDTFMSGWGRAPGGSKNVIVFTADSSDEARVVARNLRDRDEMKDVTISKYPPPDRPGDVFSLRDKAQAPRFYDPGRPFRENPLDGDVARIDPDYAQGFEAGAALEGAVETLAPEVADLLLSNPGTAGLPIHEGYAALLLAEAITRGEDPGEFRAVELPGGRRVEITPGIAEAALEIAAERAPVTIKKARPKAVKKKPGRRKK